jgi:hypothetical protein
MRLTALAIVAVVSAPAVARGYPQFQFSLGTERCGACHLSPSGGGMLNDFGRDEAGSSVSRGGDGRFLHGLWQPPSWLALGGNVRLAVGDKQLAGRNERLAFPMQLDVQAHVAVGPVSLGLTAGVRGGVRDPSPPLIERLASREHYVAYEQGNVFVRTGRFFPVFGLRLADHTAYVRRFLGFGLLEEPYAAELAYLGDDTEVRLTGFTPPPIAFLGAGYRAKGVSAMYERRVANDTAMIGGQARVAASADEARYTVGAYGKWWMMPSGLAWLAEFDVQRQTFHIGSGRTQLAAYLGASRWLARGWLATAAVHAWDPDVTLRRDRRDAVEVALQYFPWAHVELHLLARLAEQGNAVDEPGFLSLLQLHYYP